MSSECACDGHACKRGDCNWPYQQCAVDQLFWLFRLRNDRLSWHSYRDQATREKWAAKYRARGDRVSYDGFIRA